MARCESCGRPLTGSELFRKVELEDGSTKEIIDYICNSCLSTYVRNVDELETKDYAFQHLTELSYITSDNFLHYEE